MIPSAMNVVRAISNEGFGRIRYYTEIRRLLGTDRQFQRYYRGETTAIPEFFETKIRTSLGPFWEHLPEGALHHDPNAYLNSATRVQLHGQPRIARGADRRD